MAQKVYQFIVTFNQIKPLIWRRFQISAQETFWGLHVAIQDLFGWQNHGMHRFYAIDVNRKKAIRIAFLDEGFGFMPCVCSWLTPLRACINSTHRVMYYSCPFENEWHCRIILEDIVRRNTQASYPLWLDGEGHAPPQACEAADHNAPWWDKWLPWRQARRYRRIVKYLGDPFDARAVNKEAIVFSNPESELKRMGIEVRSTLV